MQSAGPPQVCEAVDVVLVGVGDPFSPRSVAVPGGVAAIVAVRVRLQCCPRPQVPQVPPPQSTSVSVPFLTPSVQWRLADAAGADAAAAVAVAAAALPSAQSRAARRRSRRRSRCRSSRRRCRSAAAQTPPMQTPLWQSAPATQRLAVGARRAGAAAAVDVGLAAVLHAVGAGRRLADVAAVQTPLLAVAPLPRSPGRRRTPGSVPPQSTSVSVPFFTPSVQVGGRADAAVADAARAVAVDRAGPAPSRARRGSVPPQSTSVSVPFFTPSRAASARRTSAVADARLLQSALARARRGRWRTWGSSPPQSTAPSRTRASGPGRRSRAVPDSAASTRASRAVRPAARRP